MSSGRNAKSGPSSRPPPELLTYRLDGEMVYVTPADDFEHALDFAQEVFPQLAQLERERISLSISVHVGGTTRTVRVARMAWQRVVSTLATYEIVDISVLPPSTASRATKSDTDIRFPQLNVESHHDNDAPPMYPATDDGAALGWGLQDSVSEKSSSFTYLAPPREPHRRRCSSALGWIGKHL